MKKRNIFITFISLLITILMIVIILNIAIIGKKEEPKNNKEPDVQEEPEKPKEELTQETAEKLIREIYSLQEDNSLKYIGEDGENFVFEVEINGMTQTYKINRKTRITENITSASISSGSQEN